MECFCCRRDVPITRKVRVRRSVTYDPGGPGPVPEHRGPGSAAYTAYQEEMTFRWAVVCPACYLTLDNVSGLADIGGQVFNLAGSSRDDQARTMTEARYREWQRKEAEQLGMDNAG